MRTTDLTGRVVSDEGDTRTITLQPGCGVMIEGEHLEDGPHDVPAHIAVQLVATGRARYPVADEPAVVDEGEGPEGEVITSRDPVVESRDPKPRKR